MESIHEDRERRIWSALLQRPFHFVSPVPGGEFALMLVVIDESISEAERNALSTEFVHQGCRYALCAGHECSSWDDSIDWAYLESCPNRESRDDNYVETTWHGTEPLEDVAWQFVFNSYFDGFTPAEFIILCLGGDEQARLNITNIVLERLREPHS